MGALHPSLGPGKVEGNVLREDLEEMARMAGLDCIVNAIVNLKRETTELFVGDVVTAHRRGVKSARRAYGTTSEGEFDILVLNAYCKANEAAIALNGTTMLLKGEGGTVILICNTPEGQICHYTARSFGKTRGGRLWGPRRDFPQRVRRLIAVGPNFDRTSFDMIGPVDAAIRVNRWDEALSMLKGEYGRGTRVGVIPDATIQYFPHPIQSRDGYVGNTL
jgi:nickel-dependent lactate racemase